MTPEGRFSLLFFRVCLMGSLLGLTAVCYFLSGWAGTIGSPAPNIVAAGVLVSVALYFLYTFLVELSERSWLGFLFWLLILLILFAEIFLGFLPPTARDELTHHLVVPKLYASAGRIFQIPFDHPSYYPMLVEMLFTPWVRWGWDIVPKLSHGLYGFLTGLLLYSYLARRLSSLYGLLGFFFFVSTPAVLRLGNWAYVDLGLVFYSTASLLCILQRIEAREIRNRSTERSRRSAQFSIHGIQSRWLVLAGLSAGFAAATKPNGLLVLLVLCFVLALVLGREKETGAGETVLQIALFVLLVLIPLSPWLVRNFAWTGNPLYPFFGSLFAVSAGSGGGGGGGEPALGIFAKRHLLYGESAWQIAALPLRVFFFGQDDSAQYFDGVLNPMLVLFLPWAFKGKWVEEKKIFFLFAALYFVFAIFLADLRIRYILPIVPPLVILLVYGIHNVYLRIARPSLLFAALILLTALNGVYLWNYVHRVSPLDYLVGRETRAAYLTRMVPDYRVFQYVNLNLPASARIYLLFMGRRAYYCERDYFHDGGDNASGLLQVIRSAEKSDAIQAKLSERRLTHLLVREDLLGRFLGNNLTAENWRTWEGFVRAHLRKLYQDERYSVYQIHG